VLAGKIDKTEGPVRDLAVDEEYLDAELDAEKTFEQASPENYKVFPYVINGSIEVHDKVIAQGHCAVFGKGVTVRIGTKVGVIFCLLWANR
jgi:redox-sensitive bicupin YhaK (pirin superfamily)